MEDCYKEYSFEGTVLNNLGNPYPGVEVIFPRGINQSQGTTDGSGKYSFSFKTRGNITGFEIGFNVSGTEVVTSEAFTDAEIGNSQCGSHPVVVKNVTVP